MQNLMHHWLTGPTSYFYISLNLVDASLAAIVDTSLPRCNSWYIKIRSPVILDAALYHSNIDAVVHNSNGNKQSIKVRNTDILN